MLVGAKTITAVAALGVSLGLATGSGRLDADYLSQLDTWVALVAASLAYVVGTAVFRFWRVRDRSDHYAGLLVRRPRWNSASAFLAHRRRGLVFGRGARGRAAELSPWALHAIYIAAFGLLALIPLDNRALAQLRGFPDKLSHVGADYCPEPEPPAETDPGQRPGCELVLRAHALGYAKTLGDCAPEQEDQASQICRKRQADEPLFHYYWRQLSERGESVAEAVSAERMRTSRRTFERQSSQLGPLLRARYDTLTGAPRASHHLFTNLPAPPGSAKAWLSPNDCLHRTSNLPHLLAVADDDAHASARALEHVFDQLVFNPVYEPVVADCREYRIHWDAPTDACAQLASDASALLEDAGALDEVEAVLDRRVRQQAILSLEDSDAEVPAADRVVSFQCLIVDSDAGDETDVASHTARIEGSQFSARELRVASASATPRGQIELGKQLASLLAPGFGYGRLTSHQAVTSGNEQRGTPVHLARTGYVLSKLQLLHDADLFLGHHWLDARQDLLEVYPYHLHLANFVEIFRGHYQRERGRL